MLLKIKARHSNARSTLLASVRKHFDAHYVFVQDDRPHVVKRNRDVYAMLKNENAFLFKVSSRLI